MHLTYVALHEVTWCVVVWCTQNAPRRQQFHVAPAMPALYVHLFSGYSKTRYKKLVTHAESHANAVSLIQSIKAINMISLSLGSVNIFSLLSILFQYNRSLFIHICALLLLLILYSFIIMLFIIIFHYECLDY